VKSFHVPGRIEVLGKHTDYAGGRSLVCAIDRGITVRCTPRPDEQVIVTDNRRGETFSTTLGPDAAAPRGSWGNYVASVARRLSRDFPNARIGADISFESDLPADAGLSSSSALVIAIAMSLIETSNLESDTTFVNAFPARTDLAGYFGAMENGRPFGSFPGDQGVGTFGGSEDHTAIMCCLEGQLSQFSYAPVVHERDIRIPDDLTFVIASSGVVANKTGDVLEHYNRLSLATSVLTSIWNAETGRGDATLAAALESSPHAVAWLRDRISRRHDVAFSDEELVHRLDQFAEESRGIVPAAADALEQRDYDAFGALVDRSQRLAQTHLRNQVNETIFLQNAARFHGALGSSAFGGGFGGSVWALLPSRLAEEFRDKWRGAYAKQFPARAERAEFFLTRPGTGVSAI
jgi:galactokinase